MSLNPQSNLSTATGSDLRETVLSDGMLSGFTYDEYRALREHALDELLRREAARVVRQRRPYFPPGVSHL